MPKLIIEHMKKEDIAVICDLFIDAFNNSSVKEAWTRETTSNYLHEVFQEAFSFRAMEDENIVGALIGHLSTLDNGPDYYIDVIMVKADKRGNKIGKALLNKAFKLAKEKGINALELDANPKLQSYAWYKKEGFKESGWVNMIKTLV